MVHPVKCILPPFSGYYRVATVYFLECLNMNLFKEYKCSPGFWKGHYWAVFIFHSCFPLVALTWSMSTAVHAAHFARRLFACLWSFVLLVSGEFHYTSLRFILTIVTFIIISVQTPKPNSDWEVNTARVQVIRPVFFSHIGSQAEIRHVL